LFAPSPFHLPVRFHDSLTESGVECVPNSFFPTVSNAIPHLDRFEVELAWLELHVDEIDRIFHCDSADSFFQGSPFSEFPEIGLTFVGEGRELALCPWNSKWMSDCYGSNLSALMWNEILCSGSIGGDSRSYLTFLRAFTNGSDWKRCQFRSADQAILNHFVWSGEIQRFGLTYKIRRCQTGFFTMTWCDYKDIIDTNNRTWMGKDGKPIIFIHQYDRFPALVDRFSKSCHLDGIAGLW
jgi:hypothetical protein